MSGGYYMRPHGEAFKDALACGALTLAPGKLFVGAYMYMLTTSEHVDQFKHQLTREYVCHDLTHSTHTKEAS